MAVFSRSFVRKRVISLATTTLVATTSLAFSRGPTPGHHLPRAMTILHAADRPNYSEEPPFLSERDVAINRMLIGMTVEPASDAGDHR